MPVLAPEPFAYPANPFDCGVAGRLGEGQWWVMHTGPRAEKALARRLFSESVAFFLPVYKKSSHLNGRQQTSYPPLFPGYVFVWGDGDARYRALASNHVARCLPAPDDDRLATDLASVYRLMAGERPLAPAERILPGTAVEVIDGPFAGMSGKLERAGPQTRLIVEVQMLNQGVSVEFDQWAVRPLSESGRKERARTALLRG